MTTLNALHMTRVKDSVPVNATPVVVRQLSEYTREYYRQQGFNRREESICSHDTRAASYESVEGCPCEDKEKGWITKIT